MENTLMLPQTSLLEKAQQVFDTMDISEITRLDYRKAIKHFISFLSGKNLTHNSFLEFKQSLALRTDIGVSSKNKYLISARILLKEMNRTGLLPADITQNTKGFKQGKKHKRDGLNNSDIEALTEKINSMPETPANIRFKALASLLIFQGLRQVEITRLDVTDIDLKQNIVMILGKGEDDKVPAPIHPAAAKYLSHYISFANITEGPLFFYKQRLCTRSIRRIVKKELIASNINNTTHGFRHFFTTTLIKQFKGNLLQVAQHTRHKSLDTLQIYNDDILAKESLPQYYSAFSNINL